MCKRFALGLAAAISICSSGFAQEVTLRAVTAFAEKTTYSRPFEKFIEQVNAEGKGIFKSTISVGQKRCRLSKSATHSRPACRHRQHDRRFHDQRHAGIRCMETHGASNVGASQERRLRLYGQTYAEKMNAIFLARLVDNNQFIST
jgi:hypothetical protein